MNSYSALILVVEKVFQENNWDTGRATIMASNRPDLGEYQFNGAYIAALRTGENPRALADRAKEALEEKVPNLKITIQGPGYLFLTPNTTK